MNTSHYLVPNRMQLASYSTASIQQVRYIRFVLISLINLIVSKILTEHFQYQFGNSASCSSGSWVRHSMDRVKIGTEFFLYIYI